MSIFNFLRRKYIEMNLEQWYSKSDEQTQWIINRSLSILNISSPADFTSVSILKFDPEDTDAYKLANYREKCCLFNSLYSQIILPFFSRKRNRMPVVLVTPIFESLPVSVKTITLAYTLFFIDWQMKLKNYEKEDSLSQNEKMTLQYCCMFFSECESFKLCLSSAEKKDRRLNITGIEAGIINNECIGVDRTLQKAVELLAKIFAASQFCRYEDTVTEVSSNADDFFTGKLDTLWDGLKNFFSKSRPFEQSIKDYLELDDVLSEKQQPYKTVKDIALLRIRSVRMYTSGNYEAAVKLGEQYVMELRKRAAKKHLAFALSNLHSYYCCTENFEKAESIMPELKDCAIKTGSFITLAYAYMNSLSNPVLFLNKKHSIERFMLCLDALDCFTEEEFKKQNKDIVKILKGLTLYFGLFVGMPEMKPVGDKFIELSRKAGL